MFTKLTESDVVRKAFQLIEEDGFTTTLDIKKALRKEGFWVFQHNVSKILAQKFAEWNLCRSFNGDYYLYTKIQTDSSIDSADNSEMNDTTVNVKKPKIIEQPNMLDDDIYKLIIEFEGKQNALIVSTENDLVDCGDLVYKVSDMKGNNWYLYSQDKDMITRHRAIYYVWKVVSQEYDQFVKYREFRSKKIR